MVTKINDPISSLSHLFGIIFSIPISFLLIILSVSMGSLWHVVSFSIFGISLLLLYSASTVYHMIPIKKSTETIKKVARKIDHMMIFILIAGTYTPVCLINLRGAVGYTIISIIWIIAICGVIFKLLVLNDSKIFRNISTGLYLIMGWISIFAIYPIVKNMSTLSFIFLLSGGISYSIGAIIYLLKNRK